MEFEAKKNEIQYTHINNVLMNSPHHKVSLFISTFLKYKLDMLDLMQCLFPRVSLVFILFFEKREKTTRKNPLDRTHLFPQCQTLPALLRLKKCMPGQNGNFKHNVRLA